MDRGILAQTVKEEKGISNESNSLGSRQDKLRKTSALITYNLKLSASAT